MKRCLTIAVFAILLLETVLCPALQATALPQQPESGSTPMGSIVRPLPLTPDPDLTEDASFVIEGQSDEFAGEMTFPADNITAAGAVLTWGHDDQTLNWTDPSDPDRPSCADFVYVYLEFD